MKVYPLHLTDEEHRRIKTYAAATGRTIRGLLLYTVERQIERDNIIEPVKGDEE